jgi:iron(III) transport system substrate-binding protein
LLPELRGTALAWIDAVYVLAWNTNFVKATEAPKRFRDLLGPRWKGRFALNVLGGAPFDVLSLAMGEAETFSLVKGLLANRPVLKGGTPAVSGAITTGEAWLGVSSYLNVERAQRLGEPQSFRFAEDFIPVMPLHIFVPAQAPHPNTARLFAAWLVTEGARIVERMDASSRMSDPESGLAKALAARPPNARIVEERSLADIRATRAFTARVQALFTGRR